MLIYKEVDGVPSWFQKDSEVLRSLQSIFESTVDQDAIVHQVKLVNPFFEETWQGRKPFEIRCNDRDYKVGDWLYLREYFPTFEDKPERYGRWMLAKVTYLLSHCRVDGLLFGWVCMTIDVRHKSEEKQC